MEFTWVQHPKITPNSSLKYKLNTIQDCQILKISLTKLINTVLFWKTGEA